MPKGGKERDLAGRLADAMSKLDRDAVLNLVNSMLKEENEPLRIIEELRRGLGIVGRKFEDGEYFLTDLMWSAEIFKAATAAVLPKLKNKMKYAPKKGRLLIGTVKGDIHDVGKNLVVSLAECAGFEVIDLGVDVSPEVFVQNVERHKPQIVGMSGLLTASIDSMQETIKELEKAHLRNGLKIIVGGGAVGESLARGRIRADAQVSSAVEGIQVMEKFMKHETRAK